MTLTGEIIELLVLEAELGVLVAWCVEVVLRIGKLIECLAALVIDILVIELFLAFFVAAVIVLVGWPPVCRYEA